MMTDNLITNESQFVVGELFKFEIRSDFKNDIKDKYTYFVYNGYKQLDNGAQFHEFVTKIKRYRKPVLAVYENEHFYDYEKDKNTSEYKFAAMGFIDYSRNMLATYDIYTTSPDDNLYGYDEFCFNIYKSNNY